MKKSIPFIVFILLLIAAACTAPPSLSKEEQVATVVAGTLTARPPFTAIPTFTATTIPTQVVVDLTTSSGPYTITTRAQNVNLRTQPGTLFPVSRVMAQGTRLQVLGLSPGGEWASVLNDEGINGWVDLTFVDDFPRSGFPIVEPKDCQQIIGRVLDANGLPISGIGFAIEQTTPTKSLRTDAATDASGTLYAYLPKTLSGVWTVSYVSIAATSNAIDAGCAGDATLCGRPQPDRVNVTLPATGQLNFVWNKAP